MYLKKIVQINIKSPQEVSREIRKREKLEAKKALSEKKRAIEQFNLTLDKYFISHTQKLLNNGLSRIATALSSNQIMKFYFVIATLTHSTVRFNDGERYSEPLIYTLLSMDKQRHLIETRLSKALKNSGWKIRISSNSGSKEILEITIELTSN